MGLLGDMVDNVLSDLGDTAASYYTEAEIKKKIGEAYRKFYLMMTKNGLGYFETTTTLGFTASTESIDMSALTPTFRKVSLLQRRTTIGDIPLKPAERRNSINSQYLAGAGYLYQPDYKMRGNNLVLEPQPMTTEAAGTTTGLKLDYIYEPTYPTSSSADSFEFDDNFPITFDPLIELHATIAVLETKDAMGGVSDINSFRTRYKDFEAQFIDSLERDENAESIPYNGWDYSTGGF